VCTHELRPALPPREIFLLWQAGRTHSSLAARAIEIAVDATGTIAKRTAKPPRSPRRKTLTLMGVRSVTGLRREHLIEAGRPEGG
jgi:hypothetical protein